MAATPAGGDRPRPGVGEGVAVWALLVADVVAVLVVYSLLDPSELYNVSRDGLAGGLGRALVQLNFPVSLAAVGLTLLALDRLPRQAWWAGGAALALLAVVAVPGVVDEGDLDAKAVNALPALGVALALALTVAAARRAGTGFAPRLRGDTARVVVAAVAVAISLPWLTAELGFHLPGGLGVFRTDEPYAEPGEAATASVHLGYHHGFGGTLLLLSGLLLSRAAVEGRRLRQVYRAVVSLLVAYAAVNLLVQDLWHEQVVKRGWLEWDIPSAITPAAEPIWLVTLALTGLVALLIGAERSREQPEAVAVA
jgi:hypothetical protein